jgi:hypothetical protein
MPTVASMKKIRSKRRKAIRMRTTLQSVKWMVFLLCVLGLPCAVLAQTNKASWQDLSSLHTGQKIQVVSTTSKKHSGTFVNVSDSQISYQEAGGPQTMQKQDVKSVKLMINKHRLRNTLLAGAAGAGIGAVVGAAGFSPCSTQSFCVGVGNRGEFAGAGAVVGFVGGAIVGVLLPSHDTIYSVGSH